MLLFSNCIHIALCVSYAAPDGLSPSIRMSEPSDVQAIQIRPTRTLLTTEALMDVDLTDVGWTTEDSTDVDSMTETSTDVDSMDVDSTTDTSTDVDSSILAEQ